MAVKFLNGIDVDGSMNIAASDVPNLDASKITSGTLSADRIPNLSGVYQVAGDYLTLETAETSFQPLGNYLTSISSADVTAALGYVPYQEGTDLSAYTINFANIEKDNINLDGEMGWDANDVDAPATLGTYGSSYPDGLYLRGSGTLYTVYHTGHFSGTHIANWQTAYGWGNHASAGYLTIGQEVPSQPSWENATKFYSEGDIAFSGAGNHSLQVVADNGNDAFMSFHIHGDHAVYLGLENGTNRLYTGGWSLGSSKYQIWDSRDFASTNVSNWNTAYGWGNHASAGYLTSLPSHNHDTLYDAIGSADAVGQQVNERIDTEVFDAINSKQPAGNYFTDGDTVLNMANNDGLVFNDTNNLMYVKADGNNYAIIDSRGGTVTGSINMTGGGTKLSMNNGDIVGVNQLKINDPGEGIVWNNGSSGDITLAVVDDTSDNRLNLAGTNASFSINNATVATQSWVGSQGYLTSLPSHNHDTLYDSLGSANAVNARIDEEVIPAINDLGNAIPTNNNQLTNGAGYATTSYVNTAVSNLVDSAPGALNTLNELAAALGDDANFSTTVTNNIGAVNERIDTEVFDAINSKQNAGNYATFSYITLNDSATTASFIAELTTEHGAFQDNYRAYKVGWSYAGNSNLDVGFESVELAGCLIECFGGTYKHVRLTRPTTGAGGRSIYVYNDQGSSYAPGWRQIWTSDEFSNTNLSNWNTAYGWGDHSAAGYLTSLPSHNHDTLYDSLGSANAVAAALNERIDTEVFDAIATVDGNIPTNNNQLTNGAGYLTSVPSALSVTSLAVGSGVTLTESTDRADLLMIKSSTSTWGGLQISNTSNEIIFSLMGDGTTGGIYDDQNSDWLIQWTENAGVRLYHNAGQRLTTTSTGITITGEIATTGGNSTNWNTAYGWGNHASAGYLTSIPSDYVRQGQDIVSGNIHPVGDRQQLLGLDSNRWQIVFCEILDSAGQHEKNLQNPVGEKSVADYPTGTVMVWENGKNVPCTTYANHMRMGIAVENVDSPMIQGAEPVLVTGAVAEGDYLVTSATEGHAVAVSRDTVKEEQLWDCVIGKALEGGEGESHLIKTWVTI